MQGARYVGRQAGEASGIQRPHPILNHDLEGPIQGGDDNWSLLLRVFKASWIGANLRNMFTRRKLTWPHQDAHWSSLAPSNPY